MLTGTGYTEYDTIVFFLNVHNYIINTNRFNSAQGMLVGILWTFLILLMSSNFDVFFIPNVICDLHVLTTRSILYCMCVIVL